MNKAKIKRWLFFWNHDYLYGQLLNWKISRSVQNFLMTLFQRLGQESNLNFTCSHIVYLSVWYHPAGWEVAWMAKVLKKSCVINMKQYLGTGKWQGEHVANSLWLLLWCVINRPIDRVRSEGLDSGKSYKCWVTIGFDHDNKDAAMFVVVNGHVVVSMDKTQ